MINQSLLDPKSIVIVGASNDLQKPGGKVLKNILDGAYQGKLFAVNPKQTTVQGIGCVPSVDDLDSVELAIISIPARFCPAVVETLARQKGTRAFIILSAGFSEETEQGKAWEKEVATHVDSVSGCLLGPNCIGVLNGNYHGVFTTPIPPLDRKGCDLISSSGATAVFLLEAGIELGLKFSSVISVGNSAQVGIEEVLEHMDTHFDAKTGSCTKLLYLESVSNPAKFLKHASSLVQKGARIAAIKAGHTEAGSRAAASHTGALANPDLAVRALFEKAGIVQCFGRQELLSVAALFTYPELRGKNIAVITHAGGPAVMLTDALAGGGLKIPIIEGPIADELLARLNPGSSVSNPVDFLATGSAEQLGLIIDYCDNHFDHIDAMVVIFGSPGLFDVAEVYELLREKVHSCNKPIYPVLPSVINARVGIEAFRSAGHVCFTDEVVLAHALCTVNNTPQPASARPDLPGIDTEQVRVIIEDAEDGFLSPTEVGALLDAAGVPRLDEQVLTTSAGIEQPEKPFTFPLAMKVIGPVHKSDVGGVVLDVGSIDEMHRHFDRLMQIEGATGVLVQAMAGGVELFAGIKSEPGFGHLVLCGLGGVLIEVLGDFSSSLAPVSADEARRMIRKLRGYQVIEGNRGDEGVNEPLFIEVVQRLSALVTAAPEIAEMDINPLMGSAQEMIAVDTRIRIERPACR